MLTRHSRSSNQPIKSAHPGAHSPTVCTSSCQRVMLLFGWSAGDPPDLVLHWPAARSVRLRLARHGDAEVEKAQHQIFGPQTLAVHAEERAHGRSIRPAAHPATGPVARIPVRMQRKVHVLHGARHCGALLPLGHERAFGADDALAADGDDVAAFAQPLLLLSRLLQRRRLCRPSHCRLDPLTLQRQQLWYGVCIKHNKAPRLGLSMRRRPVCCIQRSVHSLAGDQSARIVLWENGSPGPHQQPDGLGGRQGCGLDTPGMEQEQGR
mmetsp:Transcript_16294/g.52004  ORF Transcript_16294/g.52004 Transcript_16294/m.52004 type:complete len:266 (+) Transcript_16294:99-896(+)